MNKRLTNLSDNLRILRNKKGHTQSMVADSLGIARSRYERYEDGTEPPLYLLLKMARFYNVTVDELLTKIV